MPARDFVHQAPRFPRRYPVCRFGQRAERLSPCPCRTARKVPRAGRWWSAFVRRSRVRRNVEKNPPAAAGRSHRRLGPRAVASRTALCPVFTCAPGATEAGALRRPRLFSGLSPGYWTGLAATFPASIIAGHSGLSSPAASASTWLTAAHSAAHGGCDLCNAPTLADQRRSG